VIGVVGVTINLLLKLNGCDFGEGAVRIAYGFGFVIRNIDKFELKKKLGMLSHYLDKLQELEYNHNGKNRPAQQVNTVSIENANFGYVDSLERPEPNPVIRGLSYELTTGQLYYVEAENGVGKSTF
jgi:ABC-type bacteriocin/lantibiotic exporter with double-glycine peptidase domain